VLGAGGSVNEEKGPTLNHTIEPEITVISRAFDGTVRRSWLARIIEKRDPLLVLVGEFDQDISHNDLGLIRRGTRSYEYYWLDRWFNVFRFHEPEGQLRNYYCNINLPPTFTGEALDYVDLDIDVLIMPNFVVSILDEAEFEDSCWDFQIPLDIQEKARQSLDELLAAVDRREFPFDQEIS